jgi:uncharacterized protein (DUF2249 family)
MTTEQQTARPSLAPIVELDVREDLRSGREPFGRIMSTVETLGDLAVLHLRATFEPVPLFKVLGKRGFQHESAAHAPDDWSVWFWRATTHWLDVRHLAPPNPMLQTLAALDALPAGHTLVQVNARVPQLLLPTLGELGYACDIDQSHPDRVLVRIWRSAPSPSTSPETFMSLQPIELDVRAIPPRDKHPTIFRTFDSLASGQALVLLNDHDPRPLRYQLAAERPDSFDWQYEAEGPELWRVRISRR